MTFENVQAGERTSHLFRLANVHNAPVVGTSDLSELALGWCTYGVGDHMAHYHVNASVPKTLIQYLIRYVARTSQLGPAVSAVLQDVLDTPISPELVPGQSELEPGQSTEAVVGPYELQDFHLYYILRFGYLPTKVAFMAWCTWRDREVGDWPGIPEDRRHEYAIGDVKKWLRVFVRRFFQFAQYKRSAIPNAPKVGSGRLALAAQRLPRAQRQRSHRVAGRRGAHPRPGCVRDTGTAGCCRQKHPAGRARTRFEFCRSG